MSAGTRRRSPDDVSVKTGRWPVATQPAQVAARARTANGSARKAGCDSSLPMRRSMIPHVVSWGESATKPDTARGRGTRGAYLARYSDIATTTASSPGVNTTE